MHHIVVVSLILSVVPLTLNLILPTVLLVLLIHAEAGSVLIRQLQLGLELTHICFQPNARKMAARG